MTTTIDKVLLVACAAILCVLPFFVSGYVLFIVNLLMVYVILALGLHIALGETGQFALAHIAFYGIGIYTAGIINSTWQVNIVVAILAGAFLAGVIGYILGALAIRMRDIYLALSTFAFGEAMQWVFLNWVSVTNGSDGYRLAPSHFFGYEFTSDIRAYPFVIVVTALVLWLTVHLSRSQLGSAFRAVRESDVAAQAMGVNVNTTKRVAFMLSAAYAGLAGGLYTTFSSFIHPDSLGFQATVLILIMVVVGGIGSVRGAIAGAVIFGLISELLRQVLSFQEIIYGAILILFMMFLPKGLFGEARYAKLPVAKKAAGAAQEENNAVEQKA